MRTNTAGLAIGSKQKFCYFLENAVNESMKLLSDENYNLKMQEEIVCLVVRLLCRGFT